ncbi:asparagine synthase (glutamine-hydrolysing) [Candidatus Magnetomoraceae bacterium gMMP-13]
MCGIAGIYRFISEKRVSSQEVEKMCQTIIYRGPDDHGEYCEGPIGFAHRRLSIIDISSRSRQPMWNYDGDAVIIFNGEIYNFIELKKELEKDGYVFKTSSDTEVIIQMYRKYGEKCLKFMNGMFAFALWDKNKKKLFMARDRLGIKPFYYTINHDGIIFASEIKAVLSVIDKKSTVNLDMLDAYMSLGYTPTDKTMFKDIYKLQPGHFMVVQKGKITTHQYWDFKIERSPDLGEKYYIQKTRALLDDAVNLRLRSDVPLGVFLSGGVDSSAVVALMHRMGIEQIKTFSVAWDYGNSFNETDYARKVAKLFNTEHHEYFISPKDFMDFIPSYIWHMDEPVTEAASISLYYIAKLAKEHVTVILSGEGSDEVFGGYPIYKYMQLLEYYRMLPTNLRRSLINPLLNSIAPKFNKYTKLSNLPLEKRYQGVSFYDMKLKNTLYTEEIKTRIAGHSISHVLKEYYEKTKNLDVQAKMQYLDIKTWLVDDLLIKADRMSMAPSLELRVPFLDYRILEFAAKIPAKYRLKRGITKYIIKKSMEGYLPKDIIYRKKMGFPTPLAILFRGELKGYVKETLDSPRFFERGYFRKKVVRKLLDEHESGKNDHHRILWQLFVLEKWHRSFID